MILHMDSDAFFVRPLAVERCFTDGHPVYFRVDGAALSDEHEAWTHTARAVLGVDDTAPANRQYIKNCIPWSCDIVRKMTARIESTQGFHWYDVLRYLHSLSEYFIYGQFVDSGGYEDQLAGSDQSFCLSFWPGREDEPFSLDGQSQRLKPHHVAMAVQSTEKLDLDARNEIFKGMILSDDR